MAERSEAKSAMRGASKMEKFEIFLRETSLRSAMFSEIYMDNKLTTLAVGFNMCSSLRKNPWNC